MQEMVIDQGCSSYVLVEEIDHLREIVSEFDKEEIIGVDLEADSMFHYQERVCLLQLSSATRNVIVDPLAVQDLSCMVPLFANPRIRKVFHGADYDIRSLYRDFGITVGSLFDTQIAARFIGNHEVGLAHLLNVRFGVVLEKKYQRKDWSTRPLPPEMLVYAVQDSCHLIGLAGVLEEELLALGRLEWVLEECDVLSTVRPLSAEPGPLFLKFKGAGRLDARSLAVLEEVLRCRDAMAKKLNRPPFKVFGNETVKRLVEKKPVSKKELEDMGGMSPKQRRSMGPAIVKAVRDACDMSPEALPRYPHQARRRVSNKVTSRLKALQAWREKRAVQLGIEASLVCSKTQARSLAVAHPAQMAELAKIDDVRTWQKNVFGRELCSLLSHVG